MGLLYIVFTLDKVADTSFHIQGDVVSCFLEQLVWSNEMVI